MTKERFEIEYNNIMNVTEYKENDQTRQISYICKKAGCDKCLCHIHKQHLYFNDPATPDDYGFWFAYGKDGWIKTCRTMDPWYNKIYNGLCKCYPNGIEDLEMYVSPLKNLSE